MKCQNYTIIKDKKLKLQLRFLNIIKISYNIWDSD